MCNKYLILYMLTALFMLFSWPSMANTKRPTAALYHSPSSAQLEQGQLLFSWLMAQQSLKKAKSLAIKLKWHWRDNETFISLKDKNKLGWGEYRFSKKIHNAIALQAPHRYHDKHTGVIAKKLFTKGVVSSIALNSLPRYANSEEQNNLADLARLPHSFHSAYARAFAATFPQGKLIQLHGFSAAKRLTPQAQQAHIILSTGSVNRSEYLLQLQLCQNKQGWKSVSYPHQTSELGATQNSIGILMRHLGHLGFTHIELNLPTRKALTTHNTKLNQFADCLLESMP